VTNSTAPRASPVSFPAALRVWVRVAALSFGGPAGQIAVMHRILVEEKGWIGERRFLSALNYCMLLPGPEAHELAIYIGWLMHRLKGGLAAGILFVLPGLVSLSILSWIYAAFGGIGVVQGLFFGLKAAVLAVVFEALIRVAKRALKSPASRWIALLAFIGIFAFALPFPLIVLAAALTGFAGRLFKPDWFTASTHGGAKAVAPETGLVDRMLDVGAGTFLSNLIMFFIILTAALTLHAQGKTEIATSREAAEALRPLAGDFAVWLYAVAIIAVGLLSIPTLAGSGGYAFGETLRWPD